MKLQKKMGLTLVFVTMLFLGACGSGTTNGEDHSNNERLSVMIWDTFQQPGLRKIMDVFTDETGIEIDIQVLTWDEYWTLLAAGAQGGSLPDVFWMHSNEFQRYADNGILLDLTDKINESELIDLDNYFDDIVELYNFAGNQYAVPKDIDTIALWYNKTIFNEAGIDYPDETWTWETLLDVSKQLTKDDGSQFGIGMSVTEDQSAYWNMIYSMGGYVINEDRTASGFDHSNTREAMKLVEEFLQAGVMPSLETLSENGSNVLFASGKIAMTMQGSWMVSDFANNETLLENADVAVLPMSEDGNRVSIYNGLGWAATADGKNTESAWKLIEFLSTEKMQIKQAELGVTMSAFKGTSDAWANSVPEYNLQAYLDMMDNVVILPYSRNTLAWQNMGRDSLKQVWTGNRTMADVLTEITEAMNQLLAEEQR